MKDLYTTALVGLFCGSMLAAAPAFADPASPAPAVQKPAAAKPAAQPAAAPALQFKDLGRIVTWRATGDHELYVKNGDNQWFRVHVYEPCLKLYPGKSPTFLTETDENNVRTSAVRFERAKCLVTDITKRDPP